MKKEKCNIWCDKYIRLKNEVCNRISELCKDKDVIDCKDYDLCMYIQDDYTNEYQAIDIKKTDGLIIFGKKQFDGEKIKIDTEDVDLNELISFCDYLEDKLSNK